MKLGFVGQNVEVVALPGYVYSILSVTGETRRVFSEVDGYFPISQKDRYPGPFGILRGVILKDGSVESKSWTPPVIRILSPSSSVVQFNLEGDELVGWTEGNKIVTMKATYHGGKYVGNYFVDVDLQGPYRHRVLGYVAGGSYRPHLFAQSDLDALTQARDGFLKSFGLMLGE